LRTIFIGNSQNLDMNSGGFQRRCSALFLLLLAALLFTGTGCRMARPATKIDAKAHPPKDIAASYNQVRLRMRALVRPMCGELEQSADAIIAGTTNLAVQQGALRWKIEGVSALREALFQPDPVTAIADTWLLCNQMADYFENGRGKESLGGASAQAAATCRRMEEEFTQVASSMSISGDVSKARALARKWAGEQPILYSIASRESALSRVLERDIADSFSFGQAVGEMTTAVDDLNRKLSIYGDQIFRQARWEAELFKLELLEGLPMDEAMPIARQAVRSIEQAFAAVGPAVERAIKVGEDAPKFVASEREAAIKAVQDEFTRALELVDEERIAAMEQVTIERIAALKELHVALRDERQALASDVEKISLKVVDRAMWRLALLVSVTVVVLLLAAVAGLFLVQRSCVGRPRSSAG
jgi:hypothetical protein